MRGLSAVERTISGSWRFVREARDSGMSSAIVAAGIEVVEMWSVECVWDIV